MAKYEDLTGVALEKALKSGELENFGTELVGMVKASTMDGHIAFTVAGCDRWVDLPSSLVKKAEKVGTARCRDHMHPLFRLTLSEGQSPEAKAYAGLLAAAIGPGNETPPSMSPGFGLGPLNFPGSGGESFSQAQLGGFGGAGVFGGGVSHLAAITLCRNPTSGWVIENTMCAECAEFRIVCLPGRRCFLQQTSSWKRDCWATEAFAE